MASYQAVNAAMLAIRDQLRAAMPDDLRQGPVNADVELLGSADVSRPIAGNTLALYLHRIAIDPHGRSRYFPPPGDDRGPSPELPVNLHFFLIAAANSAEIEVDLLSWAMIQLADEPQLDISRMQGADETWSERELLSVTPEDMSTEDLMRIWDVFDSPYTNTVPYMAKTVRLRLREQRTEGPDVVTRVFPVGVNS